MMLRRLYVGVFAAGQPAGDVDAQVLQGGQPISQVFSFRFLKSELGQQDACFSKSASGN